MKVRVSLFHAAACAVAILVSASSARADLVSFSPAVNGTVWRVPGNLQNAPTSAPAVPPAINEGTFTADQIDFSTSGAGTLNNFLLFHGSGVNTAGITGGGGDTMSNCLGVVTTSFPCYSTVIRITGTATFFAGVTYTLTHDDGAVMFAGGDFVTPVINSPAPTAPVGNNWAPAVDTPGAFSIWYMATNTNPEVLRLESFGTPTQVPEPASVFLLGTVLVGLAALKRRQMRRS